MLKPTQQLKVAQTVVSQDSTALLITLEAQKDQYRIVIKSQKSIREVTLLAMQAEPSVWVQSENGAIGLYIARKEANQ